MPPAAIAPAAPVVIALDDSEADGAVDELKAMFPNYDTEVLSSVLAIQEGNVEMAAQQLLDMPAAEAGAKPEDKPKAKAEEKPEEKPSERREGKRPLALPAEEERARPRRPSAAAVPPAHEVIDLEAAAGVGVGVSGRPLLPGEQEARRRLQRRTWTLRASRSTEDTPEESHFRFAESAWCRGGGQAAQIESVEYHFSPQLEAAWHAKKAEYDARFGAGRHTILFAFHGTRPDNVRPILTNGFQVSKVGSTTDAGYFGAGIYFSEQLQTSLAYNSGNRGMFLCKLLVGKPFLCLQQNGRSLQPGFTSHVSDRKGKEVVIFDNAAMLPVYVVNMAQGHGPGPAVQEPLQGLVAHSDRRQARLAMILGASYVAPATGAGGLGGGGLGGGLDGGGVGGGGEGGGGLGGGGAGAPCHQMESLTPSDDEDEDVQQALRESLRDVQRDEDPVAPAPACVIS